MLANITDWTLGSVEWGRLPSPDWVMLASLGDWFAWAGNLAVVILMVAFGLGLVIFVHELGHFLVAKACGVRCDKFYVGFDVPIKLGWGRWGIRLPAALWKRQWGETEYGIGILPLGGYVKMLGQDDNPSKTAEEMRRARVRERAAGDPADADGGEQNGGYELDPRSYLAKSVPQRMAIISAGVVMNLIFAFIFAVIAYQMGVPYTPAGVSGVVPGETAWEAGLRSGDEILEVNGAEIWKFDQLRSAILLGDHSSGSVTLKIRRNGKEIETVVRPDNSRTFVTIGVVPPQTTRLDTQRPVAPHSPAARAGQFQGEDEIVAVAAKHSASLPPELARLTVDNRVRSFVDLQRQLALLSGQTVTVTVSRPGADGQSPRQLEIDVEPNPFRRIGAVMRTGPITAVQQDSPAKAAGIQAGDLLVEVDGQGDLDPLQLAEWFRQRAIERPGEPVRLTVSRNGEELTIDIPALQIPLVAEQPMARNGSASVPALGIAYEIVPQVVRVIPGTPADGKLQVGDRVVSYYLEPAKNAEAEQLMELTGTASKPIVLGRNAEKGEVNWAWTEMFRLQWSMPDTAVRLTVERDGKQVELATIVPAPAEGMFFAPRGFNHKSLRETRRAASVGEALELASEETVHALTAVVRFLRLLTQKPDARQGLAGPVGIVTIAGISASEGVASLLIFLTLLSANLAVVNFLPIPVLDGGHMVFLVYEGIRGKPPSEKVLAGLQWIGLLLILGLMIYVLGLDIRRLLGWL